MTTLLDLIRHRRAQLETTGLEHLGPITDDDRKRAIQQIIANALDDPAEAELLRKVCAIAPEVEAWVKEIESEMQEEAKARAKLRADDAWPMRPSSQKHRGFIPGER